MNKRPLYSKLFILLGAVLLGSLSSLSGTTYATIANSTLMNPPTTIPVNITTEVFTNSNFSGNSTTLNENVPLLEDPFQDSISSLIVSEEGNSSNGYMIEICEHKSYAGNCMILGPGEHDIEILDWLHDQISSIRHLTPQTVELKNVSPGILFNGSS